jgi:protein-disulfide isomerase
VRFSYQHIILLGPESQLAAEASECAADQGAFWDYHDRLFDAQQGKNLGAFRKDNLVQYAAELGLETAAFSNCLDSEKYIQTVREESATAASLGVRGTPSFLINGRPLIGAQPFEVFQQYIETEISKVRSSSE